MNYNKIFDGPMVKDMQLGMLKRTLTAEEIRNGDSTPIVLIPEPGVGKAISIIKAEARLRFETEVYDNASGFYLENESGGVQFLTNGLLTTGFDSFQKFEQSVGELQNVQENSRLFCKANADSTEGDSPVDVYVLYQIIEL